MQKVCTMKVNTTAIAEKMPPISERAFSKLYTLLSMLFLIRLRRNSSRTFPGPKFALSTYFEKAVLKKVYSSSRRFPKSESLSFTSVPSISY